MADENAETQCPICQDMEWEIVPGQGARRCQCYFAKRKSRLWKEAAVPARYQSCSFDTFDLQEKNLSLEKAKKVVSRFAETYPIIEEGKGLLLVGPCGVGKTHLAVSLLRVLTWERQVPALFIDHRDLIRRIQDCYAHNAENTVLEVLSPVIHAEVLVLDELGAGKTTTWVKETITHIINARYNEKRVCIITSNYLDRPSRSGEETMTERIGERLRSRFYEMCQVIEMYGDDFRKKPKRNLSQNPVGVIRS